MHIFRPCQKHLLKKFKKDPAKIVGGVAFTRLDTFCDGQSDRCTGKSNMSHDPDGTICLPTLTGGDIITGVSREFK